MADGRIGIICVIVVCVGLISSQDTEINTASKTNASSSTSSEVVNKTDEESLSNNISVGRIELSNETSVTPDKWHTLNYPSTDINTTEPINGNQSDSSNQTAKPSQPKWSCAGRQMPEGFANRVIIVNETSLLKWVNTSDNATDGCAVVLFFAQFCEFSAKLAAMFNAFGRAYNNTPVLALDAYKHNSMNARLGVVATPTILIFHAGKPVLKFNHSKTLEDLRNFVRNYTGLEGNLSVEVSPEDYKGPVCSVATQEPDYCLVLSTAFLMLYGMFTFSKSNYGLKLWAALQTIQFFKRKIE